MTSVRTRTLQATPEVVWEILADGWLYPLWVVGASRMREVESQWPATGSRIHHSIGSWPVLVDDETEVLDCREGERLVLQARVRPWGEARIEVGLTPRGPDQTEVTLEEDVVEGLTSWVPFPLRHAMLAWRNAESLRRLAFLAERRPR